MRLFFAVFIISLGSLSAQMFIGKINPIPDNYPQKLSSNDTIKILAVMVDFKEDKDETTYGNGKFGTIYTKDYGTKILDPLPHNKNYFENHLEFTKNYFQKVSKNKIKIVYNILPDIYTVSKTIRNYSPPSNSSDLSLLGSFTKEVWQSVATNNPALNFNNYELFVVFHAGVGRDVTVPGSFGNEKDLPSVYLSDKALKKIFENDLAGLPQNSEGKYNTAIIPETESREISGLGGTALIQLTINGLLVSSVASHLGLPDLFDTNTGLSAIGRFGLMDGQAIFAYSGAFPPELSAWEKIYLGLEKPIESGIESKKINLTANLAATINDTTILKVPINSSEYFLVENRNRDVNKDGAQVKYIVGDEVLTKTFIKDATGFYSWSIDSLNGVITDVDEFDWALPGNGIVIWHIDENIVNEKLADNQINTDKFHRGVDIEEADGIQDIGEKFQTIFGDEVIGEGSDQDFWYKGNKAKLYKNKFTKDSEPNTKSYSEANSLISFMDFSPIGNKMSFNLSWGDTLIKPLIRKTFDALSQNYALNLPADNKQGHYFLTSNNGMIFYKQKENEIDTIFYPQGFSAGDPALFTWNGEDYLVTVNGDLLTIISTKDGLKRNQVQLGNAVSADPVVSIQPDNTYNIYLGTDNGNILVYKLSPIDLTLQQDRIINIADDYSAKKISVNNDFIGGIFIYKQESDLPGLFFDENFGSIKLPVVVLDLAITKNSDGNLTAVVLTSKSMFYIIEKGKIKNQFQVNGDSQINSFSLGNLKQDGGNYILFNNRNKIEARNLSGAIAENFPFEDPAGEKFGFNPFTAPLIADFTGDKSADIISTTNDGRIIAVDGGSGKLVDGFPLTTGYLINSSPVLFNDNGKISLATIAGLSTLFVWNINPTEGTYYWTEENGNNLNSSFVPAASSVNLINSFFPKERAYNWPNPVYDEITFIRYYVGEDSQISIKIFDLAGDFITQLKDFALGGFDKETIWNVKDIQSGVYLARIEAVSISGRTENNIIKIAIIK
jgi:hypothetical protein